MKRTLRWLLAGLGLAVAFAAGGADERQHLRIARQLGVAPADLEMGE